MDGRHQAGLSLAELMVSVALGMSVISATLTAGLATWQSALQTLERSRLDRELGTVMELMSAELRRAGYTAQAEVPRAAPAAVLDGVAGAALQVFESSAGTVPQPANGRGSCVLYAYDRDADASADPDEFGGFRLEGAAVQMRSSGSPGASPSCADGADVWLALTDPAFVTITALSFDAGASRCFNGREPDGRDNDADGSLDDAAEADCYAAPPRAGSGDPTVESLALRITLEGALTHDAALARQLVQQLRLRNERVQVH